jgi:hypothetical protein
MDNSQTIKLPQSEKAISSSKETMTTLKANKNAYMFLSL